VPNCYVLSRHTRHSAGPIPCSAPAAQARHPEQISSVPATRRQDPASAGEAQCGSEGMAEMNGLVHVSVSLRRIEPSDPHDAPLCLN
jgi:hypothetical protein